jgi:hypothetical protein
MRHRPAERPNGLQRIEQLDEGRTANKFQRAIKTLLV